MRRRIRALDIAALLESSNGENKLRRLRVEHAQHPTSPIDEQMTRFRAVDAIASVQPAQIPLDERSVAEKLGEDRASRYYALRTFSDHEVPLAGGSDWPIVSADVFDAIKAAVDRERESLSIEEAMLLFTAHERRFFEWMGSSARSSGRVRRFHRPRRVARKYFGENQT